LSLGIGEGDEVIVPSNTYIATVFAISRVGAKPVFVEPRIDTYNLDPEQIEKAITKKTKVIMPVHLFGQISEMDTIMDIAKKHKIYVVEDNAQSHGSTCNGKKAGSFGEINATSFYPGKNLGALGDGGAITTDSKILADKVKVLRNYGSREKYYNDVIGYNSRLDELQAAFLKIKLKTLNSNNLKRQKIADKYLKELKGIGDLKLPVTSENCTHVFHVFVLRTKDRDRLRDYLDKKGIGNLIHYPLPPHLQKAYKYLGYKKGDFPVAEELANTSLSIPIYPELMRDEQDYVISTIKNFYE
jgi:dTDP-4-amino-4,6-dideoxygalactose transaminase